MNKLNKEQIELVNNNIKLVYYIIKKNNIISNEDIIQEGFLALCKAAKKYDKNKGKFSTFAYCYIKNCILSYINNDKIIKPKRVGNTFVTYDCEYIEDNNITKKILFNDSYNVYNEEFINSLSSIEQNIVKLKINGEKVKDISIKTGIKKRAIYNKLKKIRNKLREYEEYGRN